MDKTIVKFKVEAAKRKVKEKVDGAVNWSKEHPAEAIMIATAIGSGAFKVGRIITANRKISHENYITNCRFYDRRHDEYVFSKRKLTNEEALYLERKYKDGMSKRQVLTDLGLIKY